jgi:hypothetical protein
VFVPSRATSRHHRVHPRVSPPQSSRERRAHAVGRAAISAEPYWWRRRRLDRRATRATQRGAAGAPFYPFAVALWCLFASRPTGPPPQPVSPHPPSPPFRGEGEGTHSRTSTDHIASSTFTSATHAPDFTLLSCSIGAGPGFDAPPAVCKRGGPLPRSRPPKTFTTARGTRPRAPLAPQQSHAASTLLATTAPAAAPGPHASGVADPRTTLPVAAYAVPFSRTPWPLHRNRLPVSA